jgi:hypothetical protein
MYSTNNGEFEAILAIEAIERWLTIQVSSGSGIDSSDTLQAIARHTPAQRLRLLQAVLERRPALAHAARRLPLAEQLKLSLDIVRQGRSSSAATQGAGLVVAPTRAVVRCAAQRRGRPR